MVRNTYMTKNSNSHLEYYVGRYTRIIVVFLSLLVTAACSQAVLAQSSTTPTLTTLHEFTGPDGSTPVTALLLASDGNFYGTTTSGGDNSAGTLFQITPQGKLTTLYSFTAGNDGGFPEGTLIQGTDGNLYGTTAGGGNGDGTLFSITPTVPTTFTSLYTFTATDNNGFNSDGAFPESALTQGSDGLFYGTTSGGGNKGNGTVFSFDANAGQFSTIVSFGGIANDGGASNALLLANNGKLYGTTIFNGSLDFGSLFSVTPPLDIFSSLYSFNGNKGGAFEPAAGLIQAADGFLYGTTLYGGTASAGTIFRSTLSGATGVIYNFPGTNFQRENSVGASPQAALLQGEDGYLYGTTSTGGTYGHGTIFKMDTTATPATVTSLYSFSGKSDGGEPAAALVQGADGNLYGTTKHSSGSGTVFRLNLTSSTTNPPAITSLNPSSVLAGTAFTLTVKGSSFVSGATVEWNGTPLTTTFVSSTQLTASVPTSVNTVLSSYPGTATITVVNPDNTTSNAKNITITAPLPTITSLNPSSVQVGIAFTLTVTGSGFVSGATVEWNGTLLTTTFVSSTQLTATVTADVNAPLASYPGTATITVENPDNTTSNGAALTITNIEPTPAITSLDPSSVQVGTAFTLTVNGSSFLPGATIEWNGTPLTTTFVSSTQLTATVTADVNAPLTSYPGTATITVVNPGGTASTGAALTITNIEPTPAITGLDPSSVQAGTAFTLTVTGSGFVSGATVEWNGTLLTTTFVSSTQLTATVTTDVNTLLLSYPGTATITVVNPGGTVSNSASLSITLLAPILTSLSPSAVKHGRTSSFPLVVHGFNFAAGATINWNGTPLTTYFLSGNVVKSYIPANLISTPGNASITVTNPDGTSSNSLTLIIF